MRAFISNYDIGFIGMPVKNLNNFFYSKAAGQFVEFANLGIPVIVYGIEELGDFVEQNKCGIMIKTVRWFGRGWRLGRTMAENTLCPF